MSVRSTPRHLGITLGIIGLISPLSLLAQSRGSVSQSTKGDCSPTVAYVDGDVKITNNCGLSPEVQRWLLTQLRRKDIQIQNLQNEADNWIRIYKELVSGDLARGSHPEVSNRIEGLIRGGKFDEAGDLLDRLITSEEHTVDTIAADNFARAQLLLLQFRQVEALKLYKRAYDYRPQEFRYAIGYGACLLLQNQPAQGERVFLDTLEYLRKNSGQPLEVASVLTYLSTIEQDTGRLQQAESHLREIIRIDAQVSQDSVVRVRDAASTHINLGNLLDDMGHLPEAEQEYLLGLQGLEKVAKVLPERVAPDIRMATENLAVLYHHMRQYEKAEQLYSSVVAAHRQDKSQNRYRDAHYASALANLATLYDDTGRCEEAKPLYAEAIREYEGLAAIDRRAYGPALIRTQYQMRTYRFTSNLRARECQVSTPAPEH